MLATRTLIFAAVAAALMPGMAFAQDSRNQVRRLHRAG